MTATATKAEAVLRVRQILAPHLGQIDREGKAEAIATAIYKIDLRSSRSPDSIFHDESVRG